jgi:hypothetical protein
VAPELENSALRQVGPNMWRQGEENAQWVVIRERLSFLTPVCVFFNHIDGQQNLEESICSCRSSL